MNQIHQQGQHCPYLVVAAFPDRIPQVIGRTYNQIDAQTHIRFLKRRLQHGRFFLVYDPTVTEAENPSEQDQTSGLKGVKHK
ncbi:MAG: hypothetical protein F6K11_05415 [Leptolyngbya sp. SIO3F4]|nr:hypothetical protein [Leptolyngbya sp. SIO3F4]